MRWNNMEMKSKMKRWRRIWRIKRVQKVSIQTCREYIIRHVSNYKWSCMRLPLNPCKNVSTSIAVTCKNHLSTWISSRSHRFPVGMFLQFHPSVIVSLVSVSKSCFLIFIVVNHRKISRNFFHLHIRFKMRQKGWLHSFMFSLFQ